MLLGYRSRPHTLTGVPPAKLLMKRELKTRLSLVHSDISETVDNKRQGQKYDHDRTATLRDFAVNDPVYVLNHHMALERNGCQVLLLARKELVFFVSS